MKREFDIREQLNDVLDALDREDGSYDYITGYRNALQWVLDAE